MRIVSFKNHNICQGKMVFSEGSHSKQLITCVCCNFSACTNCIHDSWYGCAYFKRYDINKKNICESCRAITFTCHLRTGSGFQIYPDPYAYKDRSLSIKDDTCVNYGSPATF